MSGHPQRALVVEDDPDIGQLLTHYLQKAGFEPTLLTAGRDVVATARRHRFDVILLDLMLPGMDGLQVCRALRADAATAQVPIIMLTAKGEEADRMVGLELGADDYITKPFSFMELMARVEAVLRRASGRDGVGDTCSFGDVSVNFRKQEARKNGRALDLTQREFTLLKYFVERRGEVVSRDELLEAVWGYEQIPFTRTVDMHVAKLRKKIEGRKGAPRFILTVHRAGYKFVG